MRRIINSTYITLDGVIQEPQHWPSLGSFSEDGGQAQWEVLEHCDAVLMGRHTYDIFVPVWTTLSGDPLSDRMNSAEKFVVSTTLTDPAWNNTTVISSDPIKRIRELKEQPGQDIAQYGFGQLARELMAEGLLDELRLWIHPFFLGTGSADDLIYRPGTSGRFELETSNTLANGIVILSYRLAS
jgi:dihydrofolate reductase